MTLIDAEVNRVLKTCFAGNDGQPFSFTQSSKFSAQQTGTRPVEACKEAMKNAKLVCVCFNYFYCP